MLWKIEITLDYIDTIHQPSHTHTPPPQDFHEIKLLTGIAGEIDVLHAAQYDAKEHLGQVQDTDDM